MGVRLACLRTSCAVGALLGLAAGSTARAYSSPEAYASAPNEGGGGGRWFSGSPAEGYTCNVCHVAEVSGAERVRFPLRVTGLPRDGYVGGQAHEVLLDWPEFAQRWREVRPDPKRALAGVTPAMGLVAEFVAQSGGASGVIEIDAAQARPTEQCERVRDNLAPRLAAKLFQVRPGVEPIELRPNEAGALRCESKQLGQRCLIALGSCGASQLRLRWTPTAPWDGPIWFSAGFVATEAVSGTAARDSVDAIVVPLVQRDAPSGQYGSELGSSCGAAPGRKTEHIPSAWGLVAWVSCLGLCRRRRASLTARSISRHRLAAVGCMIVLGATACAAEAASDGSGAYPFAGLYTPGNTLGASDPTDQPAPSTLGDRCTPPTDLGEDAGVAQSGGMLRVEYRTQPTGGDYAPKNCSAVWIEDAGGRYIATLDLRARLRRPSLAYFRERACEAQLGPDVMASATTLDHGELHMATWSGRDFTQQLVPDGTYKLYIESTETDRAPGQFEAFDIQKGPLPFDVRLLVSEGGPVSEVHVSWKPASGARGAK